jgi:chloramphenicol 3-O-phosphotransferase
VGNQGMKKAIYVITGVMASGKSTVAELLSRSLERCVHLRGDVFRKMIVTGREDMCENPSAEALSQLDMRYAIAAKAAITYYEYGFSVVVQDNFLGEKLLYFVELLGRCTKYVIVLNPDLGAIKQREQNRAKKGYVGFSAESLYRTFLNETPRIGLWLDTSKLSAEETVGEIRKRAHSEARVQ